MNFSITRVITRRFIELLSICIIFSVIVTSLNIADILYTRENLTFGTFTGTMLFIIINLNMLRKCYFDLQNAAIYYLSNIAAYLIFVCVWLLIYHFSSNEFYTWMFAITKLARYTQLRLNDFHAAMLFHVFGIITVIFAPIGMNRIIKELIDNNTDEYEEDFQ